MYFEIDAFDVFCDAFCDDDETSMEMSFSHRFCRLYFYDVDDVKMILTPLNSLIYSCSSFAFCAWKSVLRHHLRMNQRKYHVSFHVSYFSSSFSCPSHDVYALSLLTPFFP